MDRAGRIIASVAAPTPDLNNASPTHSAEYDADALWRLFVQLIQSLNHQISQSLNHQISQSPNLKSPNLNFQ